MFEELRALIGDTLNLGDRVNELQPDTPFLGNIPELDSMAVVLLITAFEDQYGFVVDDDEISADTFETVGAFVSFIESKINQ